MNHKQQNLKWSLILIVTMLLWGAQHPLTKVLRDDFSPFMKKYNALSINSYMFLVGAVLLIPYGIVRGEFNVLTHATVLNWIGLVSIGFFCTGLNFFLLTKSFTHFPVSTSASFKLLIPIFATLISIMFLNEPFSWILFAALAICQTGIYLVQNKFDSV